MNRTYDIKKALGYKLIKCPVCNSKTFDYISYSDECVGITEQHGICRRCGYVIEQVYSHPLEAIWDIKKGIKNRHTGEYFPKNIKKHKRIRKKLGIKNYEINPDWIYYI